MQWQKVLSKTELTELEHYKDKSNSRKIPINVVNGVEIEMVGENQRKSQKRDYRNPSQYISNVKEQGTKSQFDDLPKIRNTQIDEMIQDENPQKKKNKRGWDKTRKDFVWKKDSEDKLSKQQKGKKAYTKWKKETKLAIPKVGQAEDENQTQKAKDRWVKRRKGRHGWKQNVEKGPRRGVGLKNNKTKAVEKKMKTKMIKKSMGSKKGGKKQR